MNRVWGPLSRHASPDGHDTRPASVGRKGPEGSPPGPPRTHATSGRPPPPLRLGSMPGTPPGGVRPCRHGATVPSAAASYPGPLPAVSAPTPLVGTPGTVSGPWDLEANCPWSAPFPRPAPPAARSGDLRQGDPRRPCSQASAVLWGRQTSRRRSSPSCSRRIHGADHATIFTVADGGTSQFLYGELTCVHGVFDRAGPGLASR